MKRRLAMFAAGLAAAFPHRRSVLPRQSYNGVPQPLELLKIADLLFTFSLILNIEAVYTGLLAALVPPPVKLRHVAGNMVKPAVQGAVIPQLPDVLPRLQKALLGQVLSDRAAVAEPPQVQINLLIILVNELLGCPSAASFEPNYQRISPFRQIPCFHAEISPFVNGMRGTSLLFHQFCLFCTISSACS